MLYSQVHCAFGWLREKWALAATGKIRTLIIFLLLYRLKHMSSSGPPTLVSSKAYGEEISQHPEFEAPGFLRYEQSPRTMMVSLVWKGVVGGGGAGCWDFPRVRMEKIDYRLWVLNWDCRERKPRRDKEEYGVSDQAKDKTWGLLSSQRTFITPTSLPEGLSWIKTQLLTLMFCTD